MCSFWSLIFKIRLFLCDFNSVFVGQYVLYSCFRISVHLNDEYDEYMMISRLILDDDKLSIV